MLTLQDISSQLASLFGGGQNQGNGVTTFGAADSLSQPLNANGYNFGGQQSGATFNPMATPTAGSSGLGFNMGTAGLALGGLQSLNGLIQGNKAFNLAKDQFKYQKQVTDTNLNNSIKSYNTTLEDRLTARGVAQGDDSATVQANIERNRLTR